jgi:glutamate synthase domain-containing protein 2
MVVTAWIQGHGADRETRTLARPSIFISPSHNPDIYSIEDLAQSHRRAQDSQIRTRMVSGSDSGCAFIGTDCDGIAKAHADIIAVSCFEAGPERRVNTPCVSRE